MTDLIVELSLVLLGAALIGWLSGRFLCKSGEYAERAERRRLASALDSMSNDLEASHQAADALRRQLVEQSQAAAVVEQDRAGLRTQLHVLENKQAALLDKLQELEVCRARHSALAAEYEQSQRQALDLRSTCDTHAQDIRELKETLERTREQLRESHAESLRRQEQIDLGITEIAALRKRQSDDEDRLAFLVHDKTDLEQQLHKLGDEHETCLSQLEGLATAVDQLHARIRERAQGTGIALLRRKRNN